MRGHAARAASHTASGYVEAALARALDAAGRVREQILAEQVHICVACNGAGRIVRAGLVEKCGACHAQGVTV